MLLVQKHAGRKAASEGGLRLRQGDPHPGAAQAALRGGQPRQLRGKRLSENWACYDLHALLEGRAWQENQVPGRPLAMPERTPSLSTVCSNIVGLQSLLLGQQSKPSSSSFSWTPLRCADNAEGHGGQQAHQRQHPRNRGGRPVARAEATPACARGRP